MKVALYRHFDAAGVLLYVGISNAPIRRLAQHSHGKTWASEIASVTVDYFPSRELACLAERAAIDAEQPRHNVALYRGGSPGPHPPRKQHRVSVWGVCHAASGRLCGWFDEATGLRLLSRYLGVYAPAAFYRTGCFVDEAAAIADEDLLTEAWLDANVGKTVHVLRAR